MFSPIHTITFPYGACEMHDIIVFELTSAFYVALPGSKFIETCEFNLLKVVFV